MWINSIEVSLIIIHHFGAVIFLWEVAKIGGAKDFWMQEKPWLLYDEV